MAKKDTSADMLYYRRTEGASKMMGSVGVHTTALTTEKLTV